jgi:rsbT co-antagonist protein RsbR
MCYSYVTVGLLSSIDWSGIETRRNLQTDLQAVLAGMGQHTPRKCDLLGKGDKMEKTPKTPAQLAAELTEAQARIAQLEREMEKQVEERTAALRREIAERKRTEKALAFESDLLHALMETLPDAIYFKDTESRFIRINKAQADRFGLEPAQAVGKSDFDFFTEEHARPAYEAEQEIIRTGQPLLNLEEKETWPDRPDTWVATTKLPLRDHAGNIIGTFGISRDITDRKQAEEALTRAYAEIEQQVAERTAALQHEVAERERLQEEVIEAQRRALAELSTPIIPVLEGVIVMPLIGSVDTLRARDITRALLAGVREHRAKVVILDITGVPLVDSGVAAYLNRTIQAARLKGARTIVTGISEAVAETIVDLGIDWSGIETLSDLQTGLRVVLAEMSQRRAG